MLVDNESNGNKKFLNVFDGRIVERVPEGTPNAVGRELQMGNNAGKTVYEVTHSSALGMIVGGGIEVKEFGGKKVPEIQVENEDGEVLQLPMSFLSHFAKPLPNVDPTLPVKIAVYKSKAGKQGLNIAQTNDPEWREKTIANQPVEWNQVEWFYSKEEPNGLPSVEKDELGDWDFRDHDKFLRLKVVEFFNTHFGSPAEEEDDVPF